MGKLILAHTYSTAYFSPELKTLVLLTLFAIKSIVFLPPLIAAMQNVKKVHL